MALFSAGKYSDIQNDNLNVLVNCMGGRRCKPLSSGWSEHGKVQAYEMSFWMFIFCFVGGIFFLWRVPVQEPTSLGWLLLPITNPQTCELDPPQQLLWYVLQILCVRLGRAWSQGIEFVHSYHAAFSFVSEMKSYLYDPLAQLFFTSSLYFKVIEVSTVAACFLLVLLSTLVSGVAVWGIV